MRPLLGLALLFLVACPNGDYARLYHTDPKAPSLAQPDIENLATLGPTLIDKGVNFSVYSERAERVELLLFDDPESNQPTKQFPMVRMGDVWNLYVEGVGLGQHYGFIAFGPNWTYDKDWYPGSVKGFLADVDADGNRFNPNKLLFDPWSKKLHRDHDWSKGSNASGPDRAVVTYGAAAKSVVVKSTFQWADAENTWRQERQDPNFIGHRYNDLIVYEVHPKGFTASAASGVLHPGTFKGIEEKADYFKDLGITVVELMPVMEKPLDGGYWGYQTLNFFAPEISFVSKNDQPADTLDEFKSMVQALHARGIEVMLDVVYNHTGEGGNWRSKLQLDASPDPALDAQLVNFDPKEVASLYSYRGLDDHAYYALSGDNQSYWNNTGVGQETRCNHRPMHRLILDSLHWWVSEMHVDGFRFDLAPILGEKDMSYNDWDDPKNTVLQEIVDDPLLQQFNTRLIAEPWSAGGYNQSCGDPSAAAFGGVRISCFPAATSKPGTGWGEWNGRFRDWWRAFVNYDTWKLNSTEVKDGGFFMTGSYDWYHWNGRRPYNTINFVTVHDGFTMYDLFSYDMKQNLCGPLNPICCTSPTSPFCDTTSGESNNRSRNWGQDQEPFKRQLMRDLFVAMIISQGTPMLLGGDEWMRTQLGNNNAYSTSADNSFNWFDWGAWEASDERNRMHDFVRQLLAFRKAHAYAFAPGDYGQAAPFSWKNPANNPADATTWGGKSIMLHYYDATQGPELAILINMETTDVPFTLPTGRQWKRRIDTQQYFDLPDTITMMAGDPHASLNITPNDANAVPNGSYTVKSRSIVVLEN